MIFLIMQRNTGRKRINRKHWWIIGGTRYLTYYILRFKEESIPSIAKEFNILKKIESKEEKGFNFVNEIDYDDKKINVAECS